VYFFPGSRRKRALLTTWALADGRVLVCFPCFLFAGGFRLSSLLRLLRIVIITNIAGWAGGSVAVVAWSHFNRQPASSDVYTGIDVVSDFLAWGGVETGKGVVGFTQLELMKCEAF
jgi:hypothetical protein